MDLDLKNKKVDFSSLKKYGFRKDKDVYFYETMVMKGQFCLNIYIDKNGQIKTKLFDTLTDDEYTLHLIDESEGTFVGEVRESVGNILNSIIRSCYVDNVFKTRQANAIKKYTKEKYGDEFEFLWEKFQNDAIIRRHDTRKWYLIIMTITKEKLNLESNEVIEVINLKCPSVKPNPKKGIYPPYHMQKKNWITVILDDVLSDDDIFKLIDESYANVSR